MKKTNLVLGYDFSEVGETALAWALRHAAATHAELHVVVAVDDAHPVDALGAGPIDFAYIERVHELLMQLLSARCAMLGGEAHVDFAVHVRMGKPAPEVLMVASEVGADLIAVGSHGKTGLRRMVQGSVSEAIVRGAECPVMVARPKAYPEVARLARRATDIPGAELPEQAVTGALQNEHHAHHRRPHVYSYRNTMVTTRPNDWPLY